MFRFSQLYFHITIDFASQLFLGKDTFSILFPITGLFISATFFTISLLSPALPLTILRFWLCELNLRFRNQHTPSYSFTVLTPFCILIVLCRDLLLYLRYEDRTTIFIRHYKNNKLILANSQRLKRTNLIVIRKGTWLIAKNIRHIF